MEYIIIWDSETRKSSFAFRNPGEDRFNEYTVDHTIPAFDDLEMARTMLDALNAKRHHHKMT